MRIKPIISYIFVLFFFLLIPFATFSQTNIISGRENNGSNFSAILSDFETGIDWILGAIGLLSFLGFLIAFVLYLTAGDGEDRRHQSTMFFVYSLFGLFLSIGGIYFFGYIQKYLGS